MEANNNKDMNTVKAQVNAIYTSTEVLKVSVSNIDKHVSAYGEQVNELAKTVRHLDKNAVLRDEFTKTNDERDARFRETTDAIFEELKSQRGQLMKLVIWVTVISSSVGAGLNLVPRIMGGF